MPSTATDRLSGLSTSVAVKAPCRVATTANITLSGLQTIDGIALADGDRVLVKDQTNTVENGIYVARSSAWGRAKDFNGNRDAVRGTMVLVQPGTDSSMWWVLTTANPVVIGTSAIVFEVGDPRGLTTVQREMQTATAGQTLFTLSQITYTPGANTLRAYLNGFRITDFTETSANSVTMTTALLEGDEVLFEAGSGLNAGSHSSADVITYTPAGAGAVDTTVQAKLRESTSAADRGADLTGSASVVTPLTNLFAQTIGLLAITAGTYNVATDVTPAARNVALQIDPAAAFTGSGRLRLNNQIPFQATPVASLDLVRKTFDSSWDTTGNIFMRAAYAVSELSTRAVVAVFGAGEATAATGRIWGGNFVAYARHATATAIGVEINCGADVAGGTSYGLVIASANTQAANAAIQIQSNQAASQFANGINFEWRATEGCVTGNILNLTGAGAATAQRFIRASGITFTSAEVDLPSFVVAATPATVDARIAITASSGTTARVGVSAVSANATVQVRPKGTGQSQLADSSGNVRVAVNSTGMALFGATPVAQPTTAGAAATFVAGAGTAVNDASTFDGYTLPQVVKALRNIGALA